MTKVFISYARDDDEAFVWRLYEGIKNATGPNGPLFDVWFDRVSMPSRSLTFHQEIRDTINERERLILVVGPTAIASDYVRQEWQFAYYAANKCVNPIVRLDGRNTQGQKVDGYMLIPEDLKLLHAEDFRNDTRFDHNLNNLIRQLSEPLPPMGKLVAVPELPPNYRAQPEKLKALRDLLLIDLRKPVVVTGAIARVGVQGMGGIGKTVLVNAIAHHPQVQRAFQDGIYWVKLGQQPHLEELQRYLAMQLGGDGKFDDQVTGKEQLRQLLADRATLIILDDCWQRDHVEAFNVSGSRNRILITTRDAGLVTAFTTRENLYWVKLPTFAESQAILGGTVDIPPNQLPPEANAIIKECGRLPLALAICGGMVRGGSSWSSVLEALREHDLQFLSIEYPDEAHHQNAWKAMDISLRVLPCDEQQRFAELSVFHADKGVPYTAVATLWQFTGGLTTRQTEALLAKFTRRSLVQRLYAADEHSVAHINLHDLLHHFATSMAIKQFGSLCALHKQLLYAYQGRCLNGWTSGPDDGYYFQNITFHFVNSKLFPEAEALVTDFSWLVRKCELGLVDSIPRDYSLIVEFAPSEISKRMYSWQVFFREKAHILHRDYNEWPTYKILFQLAIEHADNSPITIAAEQYLNDGNVDWVWLRRSQRLKAVGVNPCYAVLEGHTGIVNGAIQLIDGRILSWSEDHTLMLWNLEGKPLGVLKGHAHGIIGVLETKDGRFLSWAHDHTLRLWDKQGKQLVVLEGHTSGVSGAFEAKDGRFFSWAYDHTLRLWDQEGNPLDFVEKTFNVFGALETNDGRFLSWSGARTLKLWDREGKLLAVFEGHRHDIRGALETNDGRFLSWSFDNTLRLWNRDGKPLAVLEGHTADVSRAFETKDGHFLSWCTGSAPFRDNTLRLWDREGNLLAVLTGHRSSGINGAMETEDGRFLSWAGPGDDTLRLWSRDGQSLAVLEGHTNVIMGALETKDGRFLSWSLDNTLRLWDYAGKPIAVLKGHAGLISNTIEMKNGCFLSWSQDHTLRMWNWTGNSFIALEGHAEKVLGTLETKDHCFLSWSYDDTPILWDQNGNPLIRFKGHKTWVKGVLETKNGHFLSWSGDRTLRLWDREGKLVAVFEGHRKNIMGVIETKDGMFLSWANDDTLGLVHSGTLKLWDRGGMLLAVLKGHSTGVTGVLETKDGRFLSWSHGSHDHTLRLWNRTGKPLAVLRGHKGAIEGALETKDGRFLSWSSDSIFGSDHNPRLWDREGNLLAVLEGHTGMVVGVLETKDGRFLSWSTDTNFGSDHTLRLWDSEGSPLEVLDGHKHGIDGALETKDGRFLSWSGDHTLKLWSNDGQEYGSYSIHYGLRKFSEFRTAYWGRENNVSQSSLHVLSNTGILTTFLEKKETSLLWHGESQCTARHLNADGVAVITQNNGQVCFLHLYKGKKRISMRELQNCSEKSC